MKKYLLLIDGEWYKATLSEREFNQITEDIEGLSSIEFNIKLDNGDVIETGIVDEIKELKTFKIPVSWMMSSTVEIEAYSIDDALKIVSNNGYSSNQMNADAEYVADSFVVDTDFINNEYYINNQII